ncbi:MAG: L-seryl-tRNA(Sec) selenium transferase [Dehalococcoidia bacterium]|nr:L-seryl-tRNA(Sec) selenium transferase [Dehalococcoidia bacterium]HCV00133.1 L-seryl-tRNA(Sec) selenium transferase [Dehalococcoidia bacterium]|tara:strand:- start:9472 stop:10848 length:1377 start_codon:yes stop_codon:yes gene_type:complete
MSSPFRTIPSVEAVLNALRKKGSWPHSFALEAARTAITKARKSVKEGAGAPDLATISTEAETILNALATPSLRRVVNATGVILQTNLGRAPLSERAMSAIAEASRDYTNLEFDLNEGERGSRHEHVRNLLRHTTGAPDGLAVNNNAAALFMALHVFAQGREVIVSRGEAVEIGGGFRIPDVLQESGARLVEVGTTNRTYVEDYANAISEETAAILRVHRSNFQVTGFTTQPDMRELSTLARAHNTLLLDDLGSGCLVETSEYGVEHEPTVRESLSSGAHLTLFSGDKLLGGPQCGLIVGSVELIETLRKHPLSRALRIDKLTIAALNATLMAYVEGTEREEIPFWHMLALEQKALEPRAQAWAKAAGKRGRVIESHTMIGGGAAPGAGRKTWCTALQADQGAEWLTGALRKAAPPILTRVEANETLLDPRTVAESDDEHVMLTIESLLGSSSRSSGTS